MNKQRKQLTPDQEAATKARREKFSAIVKQIAALDDEQREAISERMGTVMTVEGHELSANNSILLSFQMQAPTIVGGFNQWKSHGRCVRKGEHGMMIWAPTGKKNESGQVVDDIRFLTITVFDVSQTDEVKAG